MEKIIRELKDDAERINKKKKIRKFRDSVLISIYCFANQCKEKLRDLEMRINETFTLEKGDYFISTLLIPEDELPVHENDFQKIVEYHDSEGYFSLKYNTNLTIGRVPIIFTENIEINNRVFNGYYSIDGEKYPLEVKIYKNYDYINKTRELYEIFRKNKKQWQIIPSHYLTNMYDIKIVNAEFDDAESMSTEYDEIHIEYEELEKYIHKTYVPVWNVFRENIELDFRVRPLKNRLVYEFNFGIGLGSNTLLNSFSDIAHIFRDKLRNLKVYTNDRYFGFWEIINIKQNINTKTYKDEKFPILSNKTNFVSGTQERKADDKRLRDLNEMKKYLKRFEALKEIELHKIEFVDKYEAACIESQVNYINNEFRLKSNRKKMLLSFRAENSKSFNHLVSFAVDIISSHFPEFEVKGILI